MKPLKQVLNDYIQRQSLNDEQYNRLIALQQSDSSTSRRLSWLKLGGVAASLCLLLVFATLSLFPRTDMVQLIAQEVTKNHIKMKPLEVRTQSMSDVQRYFTQLDFSPANSHYFSQFSNTMLGGRYCSIQGITAAQLRYRDSSGKLKTLYETLYDQALFNELPQLDRGDQPVEVYVKGLKVKVWVEKGLLMALVEEG